MKQRHGPVSNALYISLDARAFHGDGETSYVYHRGDDAVVRLPGDLSLFLAYCDSFKSLDEHARFIHERIHGTREIGDVYRGLESLVGRDLLVSDTAIVESLRANASPDRPARISFVGWITHCRLPELFTGVDEWIRHAREHGKAPACVVCDDSPGRDEVAAFLANASRMRGTDIRYFGLTEKARGAARLRADLRREGVRGEIVDFALANPFGQRNTCGANRNAFLLATAGSAILSLDDDVLPRAYARSGPVPGVAFTSAPEISPVALHPDRRSLLGSLAPHRTDIVAAHEALLGAAPRRIAAGYKDDEIFLRGADRPLLRSLTRRPGVVKATMPGLAGSSGLGTPRSVLWLSGEERERALANEETYRACLCANEVFRAADRLTIANGGFLMGYCLGLDNREMLPPFFPVGRGSDNIFGALLKNTGPDDMIGYLPFALFHDPEKRVTFSREDLFRPVLHLAEIVLFITQSYSPPGLLTDPWQRLEMLGRYFMEISRLAKADFHAFLKTETVKQLSGYARRLEALLRLHQGTPSFWADDIDASIETIDGLLDRGDFIIPADLAAPDAPGSGETMLRKILSAYGELLVSWRAIYAAAVRYNREDGGFFRQP